MEPASNPTTAVPIAERGIVRSILVFGSPLVLGMGFHALFNLVDLWIVGKLGTAALAAVTIATMINTLPMVICNGISTSSIAFMARNIGFRNLRRANEFMRQSFLLVFGLSVVLGVLPYLYAAGYRLGVGGAREASLDAGRDFAARLAERKDGELAASLRSWRPGP